MMLYISGAIVWVIAWAIAMPTRPAWHAFAAGFFSFIGLVMWELAMRNNRKRISESNENLLDDSKPRSFR